MSGKAKSSAGDGQRMLILLRGINVGGHNKVPMADLRSALATAGFDDVATYIQSGNIAVTTAMPAGDCATVVRDLLTAEFDVDVPVIALPQADVPDISDGASFDPDGDPSYQLIYFASGAVDSSAVGSLDPERFPGDAISATAQAVYVHYGSGQAKSKLTLKHLEGAAGVNLTGRNLKTVAKLIAL